jgi:PAS domain S-box-containing protein
MSEKKPTNFKSTSTSKKRSGGAALWSHEILDAAPDAMIVTDQSGRMVLVNRMTEALFGYARDELLGATVELLVPIPLREDHQLHRAKYAQSPTVRPMGAALKLFGRRKDATEFPVEIGLSPLRSGSESYVIAAIRDITERRRIESALLGAERLVSLGTLTAVIAHEINGPVGAALLNAETALETALHDGPMERVVTCLRHIEFTMDRCGQIVKNILKFSRNDAGDQVPCNLNDIIWRVNSSLRPQADEQQATIQLALHENLPSIVANPLELEILVANLARNAIESKAAGVRIEIRTSRTESGVSLTVCDDGRGMQEAHLKSIFEPFSKAREYARGTGLGMSIVHRIVQLQHASIEIDSKPGVGTSVRVDFPQVRSDSDQG